MSNYIKTFANRAAFASWRGGLNNATYAGSYVVKITEGNETLSFSINVGKPIQQAGLNDFIVWDSTDSCYKAYPQSILTCPRTSSNLTGKYCKLSEVFPSALTNCTAIGTIIDKSGSKLKIAAIQSEASKPWYGTSSSYDLLLNGVHTSSSYRNAKGGSYWTGAWDWFLTNLNYASNPDYVGYWIGVTKTAWDTAVASYKAGEGNGQVVATGQIAGGYYVQDYNFDYDLFQRRTILMKYPALPTDMNAVIQGAEQTHAIVEALYTQASIARTDTSTAVGYCRNYSAANLGVGSWWLPTPEEAIKIEKARASIGMGSFAYLWTCVQASGAHAWFVRYVGLVDYTNKSNGSSAVPVAALDICNL